MEFKPFPKISQLGKLNCTITQKIHGCLSADTKITLIDGSRKCIFDIVNSTEDQYVMGMDAAGNLMPSKILKRWNNGPSDDWLTVKVTQLGRHRHVEPRNIQVTPNHKFFVKSRGYVAAEDLNAGDKLISICPELGLSFLQEQVLIGKMLGDGSYDKRARSVGFGHQVKHIAYLLHTLDCLGWAAGKRQMDQVSGYGTTMCRGRSKSLGSVGRLFDPWVESGVKKLPPDLSISPIALAFWYMDDGSLSHNKKQEDRALFATNGFAEDDISILVRELSKYGMSPVIFKSKGFRIRLNKNCADILFTLITPYIIDGMQYKLPKRFRGLYNFKIPSQEEQVNPPIIEQEVVRVFKQQLRTKDKNRYDLETESHNYFADNILVHNSNAQIHIYVDTDNDGEPNLRCGSRNRWLTPGDDNFGFADFVHSHKAEFIDKLGFGTHYGEWAGPGINSGEGLTEKTFILFDFWRYPEGRPLPPRTRAVPVLYQGPMDLQKIDEAMQDLKENGSKLVPGFMHPEGIVVTLNNERYKKVFKVEETQWTKIKTGVKNPRKVVDYSHLLQPIRLEKLLSKDERYMRDFPDSLPKIVADYFADLVEEGQIQGDEAAIKSIRKGATGQVFAFIKAHCDI